MGKSTIKQLAETVQYTDSTRIYRVGNLRILTISGASPTNTILYEQDRPNTGISGTVSCNTSDGNLYCAVGKVDVTTAGAITCYVAATYYSGSSGYSVLYSPNKVAGTVIWTV